MPPDIVEAVGRFVAKHHVEQPFIKRERKPAEARRVLRGVGQGGE
jgi:hypothetical protein